MDVLRKILFLPIFVVLTQDIQDLLEGDFLIENIFIKITNMITVNLM